MSYVLTLLVWLVAALGLHGADQGAGKAPVPAASTPAAAAAAGGDDNAHLAKLARIHELFELTDVKQLMTRVLGQVNTFMERRLKGTAGFDQAVFDRSSALEKTKISTAVDIMVKLYDQHFSDDDVKAIIAYYSTDAGQHYRVFLMQAMPPIMQSSMEWFTAERARLVKEIDAGEVTADGHVPVFGALSATHAAVKGGAVASAAPAPAAAAEHDAKLADVRIFRAIIKEDAQIQDAMDGFVASLKAQKQADAQLDDAFWAALGKQARADIHTLDAGFEALYCDALSHDDVRGLIAFNNTDTGARMRKEIPALTKEYGQAVGKWALEIFEQAKEEVSSEKGAAEPAGGNEPENEAPPVQVKPARNGTD